MLYKLPVLQKKNLQALQKKNAILASLNKNKISAYKIMPVPYRTLFTLSCSLLNLSKPFDWAIFAREVYPICFVGTQSGFLWSYKSAGFPLIYINYMFFNRVFT